MLHWFYVYISVILSYIHMWNFRGIEQISTMLLTSKGASVICTGLYLRMKRKNALRYEVLIFRKSRMSLKPLSLKGIWNNLMNLKHNVWRLHVGLQIWNWHIFGSEDFHLKRKLPSCITKYRLLVWMLRLRNQDKNCEHTTRSEMVSLYSVISKYQILILCLIGIILHHSKNTALKSYEVAMQNIEYGLKYVIQSLCVFCNDLWLFPLTKKTLCD